MAVVSTSPGVSIVIPTYQRCASVLRALRALERQTVPADEYEVIVSIDGSDDGTREMATTLTVPYRLQVLWQPNRGRSAACNAGIKVAGGALLVLIDDDMEPSPRFVAAHRDAHPDGSRLAVVGAAPVVLDGSSSRVVRYVGQKFNRHLETLATPGYRFTLTHFYSGNFSICRQTLLEVGGFDEDFTAYGNEDLELFIRLQQAGVHVVYSADSLARQHYAKDFTALARDNIAKGRTAVLLAEKHPDALPDLKLSTYDRGPLGWRLTREALLWLTRSWSGTTALMIALVSRLPLRSTGSLQTGYAFALDYFYWVGARSAQRSRADRRRTFGHERRP